MEKQIKYYSVDDENGMFKGFIQASSLRMANRIARTINPVYKVTACLTERFNKTYQRKYRNNGSRVLDVNYSNLIVNNYG